MRPSDRDLRISLPNVLSVSADDGGRIYSKQRQQTTMPTKPKRTTSVQRTTARIFYNQSHKTALQTAVNVYAPHACIQT